MEEKYHSRCQLIAGSFAAGFLAADELAHLQKIPSNEPEWRAIESAKEKLAKSFEAVQPELNGDLGTVTAVEFSIHMKQIEKGLSHNDISEVRIGANKLQEMMLRDGLIAIAHECGGDLPKGGKQ